MSGDSIFKKQGTYRASICLPCFRFIIWFLIRCCWFLRRFIIRWSCLLYRMTVIGVMICWRATCGLRMIYVWGWGRIILIRVCIGLRLIGTVCIHIWVYRLICLRRLLVWIGVRTNWLCVIWRPVIYRLIIYWILHHRLTTCIILWCRSVIIYRLIICRLISRRVLGYRPVCFLPVIKCRLTIWWLICRWILSFRPVIVCRMRIIISLIIVRVLRGRMQIIEWFKMCRSWRWRPSCSISAGSRCCVYTGLINHILWTWNSFSWCIGFS